MTNSSIENISGDLVAPNVSEVFGLLSDRLWAFGGDFRLGCAALLSTLDFPQLSSCLNAGSAIRKWLIQDRASNKEFNYDMFDNLEVTNAIKNEY
ncbi:hypothetical protein CC78DRAFT_583774 [Lojkania enalia]|uniref:Uncharacterized protein n=1 Tax=Lojkania enalia TaxID=147567 RepID=A0A9P4K762_9PLEO|nr:hypothetical protein CC78DRAFT_583774 [Didymosphaeria enalia]